MMEPRERDGLFFSQSQNLYESWTASIRNSNSCLSTQHLKRMFFAESSLFRSKKSQRSLPLGDSCTYSLNFAATGDAGKMRYCHCLYLGTCVCMWISVYVFQYAVMPSIFQGRRPQYAAPLRSTVAAFFGRCLNVNPVDESFLLNVGPLYGTIS